VLPDDAPDEVLDDVPDAEPDVLGELDFSEVAFEASPDFSDGAFSLDFSLGLLEARESLR
jgi:hypothetical protein